MRSDNFSYGMRAVVGGYLFYLAYQLIGGHFSGESLGVLFPIAGAAFVVIGCACVFSAVRFFGGKMGQQESVIEKQFDEEEKARVEAMQEEDAEDEENR